MSNRKRKYSRPPPAFMDASATVHASRFAGARLTELKDLWKSMILHKSHDLDEVATSSCSNDVFLPQYSNTESMTGLNSKNGTMIDKEVSRFTAPFLSGGGKSQSRRHLRRRTGSHVSRRHHRRNTNGVAKADKSTSRRARRKSALLVHQHRTWQNDSNVSLEASSNEYKKKLNWLETHLWHSKRFKMVTLFGWSVPFQHCNRGSKAALRLCQSKCTIQDATWEYRCIEIHCKKSDDCEPNVILGRIVLESCGGTMNESIKLCLSKSSILEGYEMFDGILHIHGLYPAGAVGPANFLITKSAPNVPAMLQIFLHPSIQTEAIDLFKEIIDSLSYADKCEGPKFVPGGMGFIRVRGKSSTDVLQRSFQTPNIFCRFHCNTFDELSDGSIVSFQEQVDELALSNENIESNKSSTTKSVFDISKSLFIKRNSDEHYMMSGWDIICKPDQVMCILSTFHLNGACAIGLREEWAIRDECMPNLLVFPRDYPDTKQGQLYWDASCDEWSLIRKIMEGKQKFNVKRSHQQVCDDYVTSTNLMKVDWRVLVSADILNSNGLEIMVVRGKSFGNPFLDILNSSGVIVQPTNTERPRRNRRKVTQRIVQIPNKLSAESKLLYREACSNLRDSLTLPALLLCSLRMEGKGMLRGGTAIFPRCSDDERIVLGYATVGTFSSKQGICIGLCYVGAARFLSTLLCDGNIAAIRSLCERGIKRIELRVYIRSGNSINECLRPATLMPMF